MRTGLVGGILSLIVVMGFSPARQSPERQPDRLRLAAILKKAEDYCQRLENAALDFVCQEEVTERTWHLDLRTDVYLYDYQYIRKNQEAKEKRNFIAVNGKKDDIRDSPLQTVVFRYVNVLFGPVGLLSRSWQAYHDFRLIGDDTLNKEKAVVIEATPKPEFIKPHCYGRIWIREKDGSVLKIVWDQRSIGNFRSVEEWAEAHEAEPRITAFSEYGLEKNGLRFPTRNYTENASIGKDGQKFVSAEVNTLYRRYKFFTVETEIKFK